MHVWAHAHAIARLSWKGLHNKQFLSFWVICPLTFPTTWKIKILKKWSKHLYILSSYTCIPQMMIIWCMVPEIWSTEFLVILDYFLPFYPLTTPKIKILKKWKNTLEIASFYTNVPKIMIICYTVPEIWHMTDVIVIFHFGLFFALLPL